MQIVIIDSAGLEIMFSNRALLANQRRSKALTGANANEIWLMYFIAMENLISINCFDQEFKQQNLLTLFQALQ